MTEAIQVSQTEDNMRFRDMLLQLANAITDASRLAKEVAELQRTVESLQREVAEMREQNQWLNDQVTNLRKQRDEAEAQAIALRQENDALTQRVVTHAREWDHVQNELSHTQAELGSVRRERDEACYKNLELEEKIKLMQHKLDTIRGIVAPPEPEVHAWPSAVA